MLERTDPLAQHSFDSGMNHSLFSVIARRFTRFAQAGKKAFVVLLFAWVPGMAASGADTAQQTRAEAEKIPDTIAQRAVACTVCHGKEGRATNDGYYPRIAGKPVGYLYNQLLYFRDGQRQWPLMNHMVAHLSNDYLLEIGRYFAALNPPYPPPQPARVTAAVLERGRVLAMSGDAANKVPACVDCHGQKLTGVAPFIPGLLGLPHDYMNAQFGAWRNGTRHAFAPDCMAQITARLKPEDVTAVSAWLAAQPVPPDAKPATALEKPLPIACGSVPQAAPTALK